MTHPHVSKEEFRDGMSCLAGAVNIVTTDGPGGRAGGPGRRFFSFPNPARRRRAPLDAHRPGDEMTPSRG